MDSVGEGALQVAGLEVLSLYTHTRKKKMHVVICFWLNIQLINVDMNPFRLHYCMTKLYKLGQQLWSRKVKNKSESPNWTTATADQRNWDLYKSE